MVKNGIDEPEQMINLLKPSSSWQLKCDDLPNPLVAPGLSAEREWYINEKIREFCPHNVQNIVCLLPSMPKPYGSHVNHYSYSSITHKNMYCIISNAFDRLHSKIAKA